MSDSDNVTNSLIYATLQDLQERLAEMDKRLTHGIQRLDARMSSMDSHLAGFYQSIRIQNDDIDEQRGRIEALEAAAKDLKGDEPKP